MIVFCVGGAFLSLENFELPYLMLLLGASCPWCCGPAPVTADAPATDDDTPPAAEAIPTRAPAAEPC